MASRNECLAIDSAASSLASCWYSPRASPIGITNRAVRVTSSSGLDPWSEDGFICCRDFHAHIRKARQKSKSWKLSFDAIASYRFIRDLHNSHRNH